MPGNTHMDAVHAEFFRLVRYFSERGWVAVERFSEPFSARLEYQPEQRRRRTGIVANEGDEMLLTVTESGGLQIELTRRS